MTTLLQSAFNTFYDYDVDFEKIQSNEFVQGYKPRFNALLKKYGDLDWVNVDKEQAQNIASDVFRNTAGYALEGTGKFMKDYIAKAGEATIAGGVVASATGIGAPAGAPAMLLGAAITGASYVIDAALEGIADWIEVDVDEFRKGDWCVIDESGTFRRRLPGAGADFGGKSLAQNTKLGVFLRDHDNDREIYNVEDGTTRSYAKQFVKRVDDKHQGELNGNPILHALKGSLEPAKTYDQLSKETNVRVGDKVKYKGELWEISKKGYYTNGKVTITSNGMYEEVDWDELGRALNDTTAQPVPADGLGTFVSDAQGLNTGEWVWTYYEDADEYHLGVVMKCEGREAWVVSADENDETGRWKPENVEKWKEQPRTNNLGKFRMAVIEGDTYGMNDYRPDKYHSNFVRLSSHEAQRQFMPRVESAILTEPKRADTVAAGVLGSVPVANRQEEAEAYEQYGSLRLRGGGSEWVEADVLGEPVPLEQDEKSNTQGMYLIGGICLAGILFYVYK